MIEFKQIISKWNINELLIGLLLFTLPISNSVNSIILGFFGFYNIIIRIQLKKSFSRDLSLILVAFFSIQVLSFFISGNTDEALKKIVLFLCFPILWLFYPVKNIRLERIFSWLVVSSFLVILFSFFNACYEVIVNKVRFDYGRGPELLLKFAPHHVYLSMFIVISILTIFYLVGLKKVKPLFLLLIVPFILFLFILPSRTALGISFIILPVFGYIFLKGFLNRKMFVFFGLGFALLLLCGLTFDFARDKLLYTYYELFNIQTVDKPFYGVSRREKIWESALLLINELPLFGFGIGDIQDVLNESYVNLGYNELIGYNAHNQYIQFLLQYGVFSLIILIVLLVKLLIKLIRRKETLLLSFWLVLSLFCFSESILNRQWGIIFFAVLICISCHTIITRRKTK